MNRRTWFDCVKPGLIPFASSSAAQVIPLEELGRPRVDVVVNCSGVFRDLFVNQMLLLDRAIKLAAELDEPDEMNFVRKHAKQQVRKSVVAVAVWVGPDRPRLLGKGSSESTQEKC